MNTDIAHHVHDALDQVHRLREVMIEKRLFRGYSGRARIASGLLALAGAAVLSSGRVPVTHASVLFMWAVVLAGALALNYGALLIWFLSPTGAARSGLLVRPALDALPPLALGAAATAAVLMHGPWQMLYGLWMGLYGLVHLPYRQTLPRANYFVGLSYVACGMVCLMWPGLTWLNPWPMALVFFAGEVAGGWILIRGGKRDDDSEG